MTKKSRPPRKSPEQRRDEAAELNEQFIAQVEQLTNDQAWKQFLTAARSFQTYSLNNLLLILAQRPDATAVAGFRQWQAKGRQVRRGEKGIKIRGYSTRRVTLEDEETGEEVEGYVSRFPILTVFDIAQTDPIADVDATVAATMQPATGPDEVGIVDRVALFLAARGWTLEREVLRPGLHGYAAYDGSRRVVIAEDLEPAAAAATALHEAAHVLLHSDQATRDVHRGVRETEAESVAYVVAGALGADPSSYGIGYVAGWSEGDIDMIRSVAQNVLDASATLIEGLTDQTTAEAA